MLDGEDYLDMDLEAWRVKEGLTYEELATRLDLPQNRQAQAYALGETWPKAPRLQQIVDRTNDEVTVLAMHKRRLAWLADHNKLRSTITPLVVDGVTDAVPSVESRKFG